MSVVPPSNDPVVGSMLWAAYGDALGFMSELVDQHGLLQRTGRDVVSDTVAWKYRVGGRYGTQVSIPAGMYSDDTQLRLATARSISRIGEFNVDAFSKVELPVWLSYALGGGKGTKAAASNLMRDNVRWFANFYVSGDTKYTESGGNGAAMRIQPHVWAARKGADPRQLMLSVLRDAVTTHGHARALVGAVLYALVLRDVVRERTPVPPNVWVDSLRLIAELPAILATDEYFLTAWLPEWERQAGSLQAAISKVASECSADIDAFSRMADGAPDKAYQTFLSHIGGLEPSTRGSGTKSVLAALALAWLFRDEPQRGLLGAANVFGSDTDTIASMAGAILGVRLGEPPGELQDKPLLVREAERLSKIAAGVDVPEFAYPDLLRWSPPKTASDAVGRYEGGLALAGLGTLSTLEEEVFSSNERQPSLWRWARTTFGQTILVKMRPQVPDLDVKQMPLAVPPPRRRSVDDDVRSVHQDPSVHRRADLQREHQISLFADRNKTMHRPEMRQHDTTGRVDLDQCTQAVIRSNFDPVVIGGIFLEISEGTHGIENAIGFAAIIAKARRARSRGNRPE